MPASSSATAAGTTRPQAEWVPWREPLTEPVPAWVRVTDAHVLGTTTVAGRPAWRISFFDPGTPASYTVAIDRQTFRTR